MIVCILLCEICAIASALLTLQADIGSTSKPNLYVIKTYLNQIGLIFLSMFHWIFALQYLQTSYIFPLLLGNVELKLDIDDMKESLLPENQFQVKASLERERVTETLATKVYKQFEENLRVTNIKATRIKRIGLLSNGILFCVITGLNLAIAISYMNHPNATDPDYLRKQ